MRIRCCENCKPPKRHSRCHIDCPEYKTEKEAYEKEKLRIKKERDVTTGITEHRLRLNLKVQKKRKWKKI